MDYFHDFQKLYNLLTLKDAVDESASENDTNANTVGKDIPHDNKGEDVFPTGNEESDQTSAAGDGSPQKSAGTGL